MRGRAVLHWSGSVQLSIWVLRVTSVSLTGMLALGCSTTDPSTERRTNPTATLIVRGGPILTMDPDGTVVEALAIADGRIIRLGSLQEVEAPAYFVDVAGVLGRRGALLSHPYADDPSTHGVRRMTPSELRDEALRGLDSGLDIATHAIGDQSIADALDVYEEILKSRPDVLPNRLRLEHFSYAREEDFERAARLGIVVSVQPNFVFPGDDGVTMEEVRVGSENSARVYAWGRLRDLGARLAFGSDYFTRPLPPLYTYYAAVTRRNPAGLPRGGWHPEERLQRFEALQWATTLQGPGGDLVDHQGLGVGKKADLVVLSADPMRVQAEQILETVVEATFLAGSPSFIKPTGS